MQLFTLLWTHVRMKKLYCLQQEQFKDSNSCVKKINKTLSQDTLKNVTGGELVYYKKQFVPMNLIVLTNKFEINSRWFYL